MSINNFKSLDTKKKDNLLPFGIKELFDNNSPIARKEQFAEHITNLSPYDRDKVGLLFDQMTNGVRLHISVMPNFEVKRGLAYYHVSVRSQNGSRGYKLPDIEGISKLIEIYIEGKHKIDLNLEDVYNASLS